MKVRQVSRLWFLSGVLLQTAIILLISASCCRADMPIIRGDEYNPFIINSERLYERKVIIQDLLADYKRTFTKLEKKRGFKEYYYVKFLLRDSKLACFVCKYDYKDMDNFKEIKKGDRITIVGYIERLGKGVKRFVNPKFIVRVDDIKKGWDLKEGQAVLEAVRDEEPVSYSDIQPDELTNLPEEFDGKYVRIKDRFSIMVTNYTNFEKDLNLSNSTAIKFRGEFLTWPCYIMRDEENLKFFAGLKTGDKITVYGRIHIRPIPDDRLVLLSAHAIKKGWD